EVAKSLLKAMPRMPTRVLRSEATLALPSFRLPRLGNPGARYKIPLQPEDTRRGGGKRELRAEQRQPSAQGQLRISFAKHPTFANGIAYHGLQYGCYNETASIVEAS